MIRLLRRPAALLAVCLAFAAFFAGACSRSKDEARVFRIIDRIGAENVIASPFRTRDPKNPSLAEMAGKFGMDEFGTGENPFGIKMKLHFGTSVVGAIAAVPPTTITFGLRIPPDARFAFGYGIRQDMEIDHDPAARREAGFAIILSAGGRDETIFRRTVRMKRGRALRFESESIDISRFAGRDVSFRLVTEGDERAQAVWINPVIYVPRRDARYVILISLDSLRPDHLTCYGYDRDTSPNIDRLARDGVRFTETRAPAPWTLPSHVSMMTGLSTVNHGVFGIELRMDPRIPTLAELLKAKGFANAAFGGGGLVNDHFGFDRGFDRFETVGTIGAANAAARLGERAFRWIEEHRDRDVFLFLHTYQIHGPYRSEAPWNGRYLRGGPIPRLDRIGHFDKRFTPVSDEMRRDIIGLYDGAIRYTDENLIGPLVAKIRNLGIYDRTMIVLTSDHGEEFFEHGAWGHAYHLYDEVLRVPLIIKFFGSRNAGKTVRTPTFGVDVMPTIAEELGFRLPSGSLDGISLLRFADGGDAAGIGTPRVGLSDMYSHESGRYTLRRIAFIRPPHIVIRNESYSSKDAAGVLSSPPPLAEVEVFDVSNDPGETRNLAADRPDLVRESLDLLREFLRPRKRPAAEKTEMDDDLLKQLKTLGYL